MTDVRGGTVYVLRHVWGGGDIWEAEEPENLTVTEPAGGWHQAAWTPDQPYQKGPPYTGRTEYYNDPNAPKVNTLIPAGNLLVVDDNGAILLQRRRDTGQWALPGGAQDIGETAAKCAVRECLEEMGIVAEITGFLGVYTIPNHIVAYTDGEIRQQYENTYVRRRRSCLSRAAAGSTWNCTTRARSSRKWRTRPAATRNAAGVCTFWLRCQSTGHGAEGDRQGFVV